MNFNIFLRKAKDTVERLDTAGTVYNVRPLISYFECSMEVIQFVLKCY